MKAVGMAGAPPGEGEWAGEAATAGAGLGEPEGGQELLESLDDIWGPPQNKGLNRYPC
jgi:hypothetical protein